jgi:hypothetical protein
MICSNNLTRCGVHTTLLVRGMTKELDEVISCLRNVSFCGSLCLFLPRDRFPLHPSCILCILVCVFLFAMELIHLRPKKKKLELSNNIKTFQEYI